MRERVVNVLFALDCFLFSLLTLGKAYPFESFSSAAYRSRVLGGFYGRAVPIIDAIAGTGHCARCYMTARLNLPEDQR